MKGKIISILVMTLLIATALPVIGIEDEQNFEVCPEIGERRAFIMVIGSDYGIGAWFDGFYEYQYYVHIVSDDPDVRVRRIRINKTDEAGVRGILPPNCPRIGWSLTDCGDHFIMHCAAEGAALKPCEGKMFYVLSQEDAADFEAISWDIQGDVNTNGWQPVIAPNTEQDKRQASVVPDFDGTTYSYSLSSVLGEISQMALILDPSVEITNIKSSDPYWTWVRPTEGNFTGILFFGTHYNPIQPGDDPVEISFTSPNEPGNISILSNYMGMNAVGPWNNSPPIAPIISGPNSGKPGTSYTFTFESTDPNGDYVKYKISWGDGNEDVTEFEASGTGLDFYHTWANQGTYEIKAQAEDFCGTTGPETTKTITMPRYIAFNKQFLNFLQNYPNMFPLFQRLFQRLGLQ